MALVRGAGKSREIGLFLILYYGYGGVGYLLISKLVAIGGTFTSLRSWADDAVPFQEQFVWLYIAHYFFPLLLVVSLRSIEQFTELLMSYFAVITVAFVCFATYPVEMIRPSNLPTNLSGELLAALYRLDTPALNCLPSLHVAISVLTAALAWHHRRWLGCVFGLIAFGISVSALLVKQHWVVDTGAGAALGLWGYGYVYRNYAYRRIMQLWELLRESFSIEING